MTEESEADSGQPQAGQPPAIVLYLVYATLVATLFAVLILVGVYA